MYISPRRISVQGAKILKPGDETQPGHRKLYCLVLTPASMVTKETAALALLTPPPDRPLKRLRARGTRTLLFCTAEAFQLPHLPLFYFVRYFIQVFENAVLAEQIFDWAIVEICLLPKCTKSSVVTLAFQTVGIDSVGEIAT